MSAVFSIRRCPRCNEPRLVSEFGRMRDTCKRCDANRPVIIRLVSGAHAEAVAVMSHSEVAREMGLSIDAVRRAEQRALQKLRAALEEWR